MNHTQYSRGQLVDGVINMDLEILVNAKLRKNRLQKNTSYVLQANKNNKKFQILPILCLHI